jgi:hypothetical protein
LRARQVVSADGLPVPQVTVKATRQPTPTDCASYATGTTYAVTQFNGRFTMQLEPGMYQFDYEPAPGSPAPRLTDFLVQVENFDDLDANNDDPVRLRRAALVNGEVRDSAGTAVARAIVRIFQPRCTTVEACAFPPQLLAETQTDDNGLFRVVMAVP